MNCPRCGQPLPEPATIIGAVPRKVAKPKETHDAFEDARKAIEALRRDAKSRNRRST